MEKEDKFSWDSKNKRDLIEEDVTQYVELLAEYNKIHISALDYLKILYNTVPTVQPNPLITWINNA